MPARTVSMRLVVVEGVSELLLDVHLSHGIEQGHFKRAATTALLYERALRNRSHDTADRPLMVPPWLADGLREATAWRLNQSDRRLYAALFKIPLGTFFPHLTLGIIFWTFFTATINDGCTVFINNAQYLKQPGFSPSVLVWRSLARNCLQLAHTIILYIPVAIWVGIPPSPRMLLFLPGFVVVLVNLHAVTITLGILCARFRDIVQIVSSMLQLLMFLTPVFWFPSSLPGRSHAILYNPLAQLLDIVRLPLLGDAPAPGTIRFLMLFTVLNIAIAAAVYRLSRRHLVYWV